jgi:hypothetical protein
MRKVVQKYKIDEQPSDYSFWESKSYTERLGALELIRKEYNSWRYNDKRGVQRFCKIVKRKPC